MIRRLILAPALMVASAGCAAGIHTGFEELQPVTAPVYAERVAVLPVTAAEGSDEFRDAIGDSLVAAAARAHPVVEFIPAQRALDDLNEAGLAERFANLLVAYQQTGLYDRALLREVGEALRVDHVLQLRVSYERLSEIETALFDPEGMYEADRQNLRVSAVLWDVHHGEVAWEAAGTSTTRDAEYERPRSFREVVSVTAARLAERLPLTPAEDVAEEPGDSAGAADADGR